MSKIVTSTTNDGVKEVVKLRNARERRITELFVVEGYRECKRASESSVEIVELWHCPDMFLGENEGEVIGAARDKGAEIIEVAPEPFVKMSYRDRPEGLLAVCKFFDTSLERIELSHQPLLLVVESIEKPGNLGTMIRAAGAANVDAVIVCDPATDVFNPNVVRSSIGTSLLVPLAVTTTEDAIVWLQEHGVSIVCATPHTEVPVWDAPLTERAAIVVGSEQLGLSMAWLEASDADVTIPMPGDIVDSLNAAASAAILLYEAVRQRQS